MASDPAELITQALTARTPEDVEHLVQALRSAGATHERPVGDRWGNRGLFTAAGGSFDHKLVELATNMQDAVLMEAFLRSPGARSAADSSSIFGSPAQAARQLLGDRSPADLAEHCNVELASSGELGERRRHRSIVFRDKGIGMTPEELPGALFRVGSSRKDGVLWQAGAFGRGGLTVLPNCIAWIVVSRRHPDLLPPGHTDKVTVAVVTWRPVGNRQTETALYQVTTPWEDEGDLAFPISFPADQVVGFEPGTHLCVVGFQSEGIWVSRLGDEKSIDIMFDTRLFEPTLPMTLTTPVFEDRSDRRTTLRGLGHRLSENPRRDRLDGEELMPISHGGETYMLRVRYYLFPAGDRGSRRRFVARDHAMLFMSNGQVHAHWTPAEFRLRTRLPKLADRILVVVDTDELPLPMRTRLFTADRTEILRSDEAVRLEEDLVSFLNDWEDLRNANNDLVREAILRSNAGRSTLQLAQRISRALEVRGFSVADTGARARDPARRSLSPHIATLLDDPTTLSGPAHAEAVRGRTTGIYLSLDATDDFLPRRGRLRVQSDHLDIDAESDITVGSLRNGRVRLSVAVPPDAEITQSSLTASIDGWVRTSGGLGHRLHTVVSLSVVEERQARSESRPNPAHGGAGNSPGVFVVWTDGDREPEWGSGTVGEIDMIEGRTLAEMDEEYRSLSDLEFDVPVLKLNEGFGPLKQYSALRARDVGDEGVARNKERYALGVGVQMFLLDRAATRLRESGVQLDDEFIDSARAAAARGVLAVLPDFDRLVAEAGLDSL